MKVTISKTVKEEMEIEVPGYFKTVPEFGTYKAYSKILSENQSLRITMYEDGTFYSTNSESKMEIVRAISEGTPISEAEFLKAVQECYTRFFLAAETSKDEAEVVPAFEYIMH